MTTAIMALREIRVAADEIGRLAGSITAIDQGRGRIDLMLTKDDATTIIRAICLTYRISIKEIKCRLRTERIAFPRQIAMYVIRRRFKEFSLSDIGRMFGRRDHGTVLHAIHVVEDRMSIDERVRLQVHTFLNMPLSEFDGFIAGDGI